jgi:hypothetical protein
MILDRLDPTSFEFARGTGWELKPEGACRAEVCVPLPKDVCSADGRVDLPAVADALGMALVADEARGLWALGPVSGGRTLMTAVVPEITLPDRYGKPFALSSLKGMKVFLATWASW